MPWPFLREHQQVAVAVGGPHVDDFVALQEFDGDKHLVAGVVGTELRLLDLALLREHDQVLVGLVVAGVDHRLDDLVGIHGKHRLDQHTLRVAVLARDLVCPDAIDLPPVGEDQEIGVGRRVQDVLDDVVLAKCRAANTSPASALRPVGLRQHRFDVAGS